MKDIAGKTAFITGGASGIGLGTAKACAKYGMNVVIADMRQQALDEALVYFKQKKQPAHAVNLNVTDREAYVKAADEAESVFGNIHVLVNNAGVGAICTVDTMTYKDWDYGMGVILDGTINGVQTILPRMLKHGEGGHIIATSSTNGIAASGVALIYCTAKFAVAGMMEALATELQDRNIGCSVLVPGPTKTNLGMTSNENRPDSLKNEGQSYGPPPPPPEEDAELMARRSDPNVWMDPVETGERVVRGIRNNDLFIITHPEFKNGFNARHEAIMRACPDEPPNPARWEVMKEFGTVIYNDIYDKQQQVGPPDWVLDY
jgi:NAD(P)-dependent dehydrogenase (short-subunit alcohol dehydrogenase family)